MANVMHSLETGQYVPDTGWYEKGLQAKLSFGQPVEKNQEGANHGGHLVVQPKRMMVQRTAQPLTGDSVTYGDSMRASRREKENKTGLPDRLKAGIENLSGYSMDDVRVHYNSEKPAQLQALAYAQGTDIHVGPGQERHLAHEAWHVVQQKQGRVTPRKQMKGVGLNEDVVLEREADVMGIKTWKQSDEDDHTAFRETQKPEKREVRWNQPPVIQRKVLNYEVQKTKISPPGEAIKKDSNAKSYFDNKSGKEGLKYEELIERLLSMPKKTDTEAPLKVNAVIAPNEENDRGIKRKTYKSGVIGKFGRDEFLLKSSMFASDKEGGHLIPHALWSENSQDTHYADGYENLVPMSRDLNIGKWAAQEKKMKSEMISNSYNKGKKRGTLVKIIIPRKEYQVDLKKLAKLLGIVVNIKENNIYSGKLSAWIPEPMQVKMEATDLQKFEEKLQERREPSAGTEDTRGNSSQPTWMSTPNRSNSGSMSGSPQSSGYATVGEGIRQQVWHIKTVKEVVDFLRNSMTWDGMFDSAKGLIEEALEQENHGLTTEPQTKRRRGGTGRKK
ncbi:MAG: DUF4157 domain-containing protein [Moorea sp. SIO1F2]|nr:DUF4157 domain-containing protein [Moorena sp. SIO1F2]